MTLKQRHAYQLAKFLDVGPKEIPGPKEYSRVQRVRVALELAIVDYFKVYSEYWDKWMKEMKPFQEMYQQWALTHPDATEDMKKAQGNQFDKQHSDLMKPFTDKVNAYEKKHGDKIVEVTLNEEDLNQTRLYFEKKGAEYWSSGTDFLEIAKHLGSV